MTSVDDPVAALVRQHDFGRWAATLFAPAPARPHLLALYAYDIELARVRDLVSEPMPGELRLQWWRDAIGDPDRTDAAAHPVAHALEAAIAYGKLPRKALIALSEARIDDLYDDPVPTIVDLEGRLGAAHSAVLRLASLIVATGRDPGGVDVVGLGGVAQGIARVLRRLPKEAARGQVLLPVDRMAAHGVTRADVIDGRRTPGLTLVTSELAAHGLARLVEARAAYGTIDRAAAPALLPLALAAPELKRLARHDGPMSPQAERARWRILIDLLRASRKTPPF